MNTNRIKGMKIISTNAISTKLNQDPTINPKDIPTIMSTQNKSQFCKIKDYSLLQKGLNLDKIHLIQIQVKCHLKEEEDEAEEENEKEAETVTREAFETRNKAREENTLKVEVIDEAEEAIAIEVHIMQFPAIIMIRLDKIKNNTRNLTSKYKIFH